MNRKILYLLLFITLVCFTGCTNSKKNDDNILKSKTAYSITDATGYKLVFDKKPERIVSLTSSTDEILFALVSSERIVALTYLVDDPGISNIANQVQGIPNRFRGNSAEALLALNPDLIIVADWFDKAIIKTLREMGLKVYVYKTPNTIAQIKQCIKDLGQLVGEKDKSIEIVKKMDKKINYIENRLKNVSEQEQKRALQVRSTGVYYSPTGSINDILKYAKIKMAADELNYDKPRTLAKEVVVDLNPDIFILVDWNYDGKHNSNKEVAEILDDPVYKDIKAVKNKSVYALQGAHILTLSQHIVLGIEDLAKLAYPEAFAENKKE